MPGDVGERLLDDPVSGPVDAGGQRARIPGDLHGHGQAAARGEAGEVGHPGRGRPRRAVLQQAEHPAHLGEHVSRRLLDRGQRGAGLLRMVVQQVQRGGRLHVDQRDVVGQHVVQLLGHGQPFLAGLPSGLLAFHPPALGQALAAHPVPLGDGQREQQVRRDRGVVEEPRPVRDEPGRVDDHEQEERPRRRPRRPAVPVPHRAEDHNDRAEENRPVREVEQHVDRGRGERDDQRGDRGAAAQRDGARPDQQQRAAPPGQRHPPEVRVAQLPGLGAERQEHLGDPDDDRQNGIDAVIQVGTGAHIRTLGPSRRWSHPTGAAWPRTSGGVAGRASKSGHSRFGLTPVSHAGVIAHVVEVPHA